MGVASSGKYVNSDFATFFYTGTGSVSNLINQNANEIGINYIQEQYTQNTYTDGDGYTLNISVQMNIELSSNMKDNLSGYDVVGFVVWKNE